MDNEWTTEHKHVAAQYDELHTAKTSISDCSHLPPMTREFFVLGPQFCVVVNSS